MSEIKKDTPIRKSPYDWRDKVCQFCGVPATNGCCKRHGMSCPTCNGFGAVSKLTWEAEWKKNYELMNHPPSVCCKECDDYFAHSVGSHSDDRDYTPCDCNKGKCRFPNCICHQQNDTRSTTKESESQKETGAQTPPPPNVV